MSPRLVRFLRRIHMNLGVFFAPLLVFFVVTGWVQTVTPDRRKGTTESEGWLSRLNRIHTEQHFPTKNAEGYSTQAFETLVIVMSVTLCLTVLLGVLLAFKSVQPPWTVWCALILGLIVPVVTLWLGQRR